MEKSISIEFLNKLKNKQITIYLISGIRLTGELLNHDEESILINGQDSKLEGHPQLVFKNAISTIMPNQQ